MPVTDDGLLPCPFCGLHLRENGPEWHHAIADCPLSDSVFDEQQIAEWNTRVAASDRDVLVGRIAELEEALDPFARVARLHDAAGFNRPDEQPCREFFPGIWPTLGDCRKAAALIPLAGEL